MTKNNLNNPTYKNLGISANVNLAPIKIFISRRKTGMNLLCLFIFSCKM